MQQEAYLSELQTRLRALGFEGHDLTPALSGHVNLLVGRMEPWGRLLLAMAPFDISASRQRATVADAAAAWLAEEPRTPVSALILVYPFPGGADDDVMTANRSLRRVDPDGRWELIPWTADLAVELIDQHSGPPRVEPAVARAITEVPRPAPVHAWQSVSPPAYGPRARAKLRLDYLPFTRITLAVTVAAFLWAAMSNLFGPTFNVTGIAALRGRAVLLAGENWRLLTYTLLHGGLIHLGLNMWALWNIGRHVELIFGARRSALIYLTGGVVGGMATTMLRTVPVTTVGASGAVLGLLGALGYFAWAMRGRVDWRDVAGPIVATLVYGFMFRGIDNHAHIGGLIGGFVAASVMGIPGERSGWRTWATLALGGVLLLVVSGLVRLPHLPFF